MILQALIILMFFSANSPTHDGSMGRLYIYLFMVDFHGKLVRIYTSPMDPMGGPKNSYKWSYISPLQDPISIGL